MTHTLRRLTRTGHTTMTWHPDDPQSVATARDEATSLIQSGWRLYDTTVRGDAKPLGSFDPTVAEILAVPPMAGG